MHAAPQHAIYWCAELQKISEEAALKATLPWKAQKW